MAKKDTKNSCETNVTMMRLSNTIERQQCDTPMTTVDRLVEFVEAIPRDAPVDAVFDGFVKVRDNLAEVNDVVRDVVRITRDTRDVRMQDEVRLYHNVAEKWANMGPDITLREACHGVAHDTYAMRFDPTIYRPEPEGPYNPSEAYGSMYNTNLEAEIRERRIRAANELFGQAPKT